LRFGRPVLHKFASEDKSVSVERLFNKYGAWAVLVAAVTPIPYKVFTIMAGVLNLELKKFVLASIIGRGFRFLLTGILLYIFGEEVKLFIEHNFQLLMISSALVAILVALAAGFIIKYKARNSSLNGTQKLTICCLDIESALYLSGVIVLSIFVTKVFISSPSSCSTSLGAVQKA